MTEPLSLAETMRIMDVASVLRRERELAETALSADQIQTQLRQQLLAAAELTGERVTSAEIDAAIGHYYDNLHAFREPPRNLSWVLAHLYIRRFPILLGLLVVAAGCAAGIYWF